MTSLKLRLFVLSVTFVIGTFSAAGAAELLPHRALYSMTLQTASGTGGPAGIRGVMTYEFTNQCEGWSVSSKVFMKIRVGNGGEIENVRKMTTWESKDHLNFRFRVDETRGGRVTQKIRGVAILDETGSGGVAEYTSPRRQKVILPKGTVFPTAHILALIGGAQSGQRHLGRTVFDGGSMNDPYDVSALINDDRRAQALPPRIAKVIHKRPRWNARMAYFPVKNAAQTPEFELSVIYRDDGIVERMIQDYGNHAINATLVQIQLLPDPGC